MSSDSPSYQVLARKWRPQLFADLAGLQHIAKTLQNAIRTGRVSHAFLFTGSRGVGKTSAARIMAKCLNCLQGPTPEPCGICDNCISIAAGSHPDVIEIDAASNRGINEIRQLRENVGYLPQVSAYKIYIIDEVHMLTTEAFNALLKTLEEPPEHVKFILATTEPHKIPITILSRCHRYDFGRLSAAVIEAAIQDIAEKEGLKIEPAALQLLAREADGSMRDALSVLDQAMAFSGDRVTIKNLRVILGVVEARYCSALVESLLDHQISAALQQITELEKAGIDIKRFAKDFLFYLRNLVLLKLSPDLKSLVEAADEELQQMMVLVQRAKLSYWQQLFDLFQEQYAELMSANLPRLHFEMSVVRLGMALDLEPVEELINRLQGVTLPDLAQQHDTSLPEASSTVAEEMSVKPVEPEREMVEEPSLLQPKTAIPQDWPSLLEALRPHLPSITAVLDNARLLSWEKGRLTLGLPNYAYGLLRDDEKEQRLQKQLEHILGEKTTVVLSQLSENGNKNGGSQRAGEKPKQVNFNKQDIINDEMVRLLVETFDAQIEEIRPRY
ncbi:MAG TPA: DNA polymerase III subunit gamma/tau [Proteobacteria bacterium]|nr:DNA polymerase III subunit gamma/tau [Pseudomonadota bacterium]